MVYNSELICLNFELILPAGPATKAVAGRKNIDKSGTKHD